LRATTPIPRTSNPLRNDYSKDTRKRDLQLEAKAHITVQQWIDGGALADGSAITFRCSTLSPILGG